MNCIADNILSPLGQTTAENYQALQAGRSALRCYPSYSGRAEDDYIASRFDDNHRQQLMVNGLTWFESLLYHSIQEALTHADIDIASQRTILVVSTTKANIEHLDSPAYSQWLPAESAQHVALRLGITTSPVVVCNACISGLAAIITAERLLAIGAYDTAIVAGCDVVSHFVVSGFQSLKALSPAPCRPFDIDRTGLNLGEAAATIILSVNGNTWQQVRGAIRNDAFHISSPSPQGTGCASAIQYVMDGIETRHLSAINAHGTATLYNDQMEAKALAANGMTEVPVNTLKGYYGHTLGASGILETIITMHSVEHGMLFATRGFSETGVSEPLHISGSPMPVGQQSFLKIISGFGGCNAALLCQRTALSHSPHFIPPSSFLISHSVRITPHSVTVDGRSLPVKTQGCAMLTEIYKQYIGTYPKYYKMDGLCRLGFIASELLLKMETATPNSQGETATPNSQQERCDYRGVVLFNHSSSTQVDKQYQQTIAVESEYYPSPSLFVYTLPNIVCSEIAIRNGYQAETSFYILARKDEELMERIVLSTFEDHSLQSILTGWLDYQDDHTFEAELKIVYAKR